MKNIRVVFMGTPIFAVPILKMLIEETNVVMVVCQKSRKKDRKGNIIDPDTKVVADKALIKVFQPEKIKDEYQNIISMKPDIIITCAYGQIIPKELLDFPKYGCINVHGSLLPELRGGAPIHRAIINGYKETGVTVMYMDSKMDAGDIISQDKINIGDNDTLDYLYEKMSYLGADLLKKTLPSIIDGSAVRKKQDEKLVTYGYNITPEEEKIDFSKRGVEIKNLVRGLCSNPSAYCYLDDKRLKIYEVDIVDKISDKEFGTIIDVSKDGIYVSCKDSIVKIKDVKLEGKKRCKVVDFLNGIKKDDLVGKVLK